MSVNLRFKCDGCGAEADGAARMVKRFTSFSGRDYGVGTARWETTPDDLAPEGWVAADPYTYCTYCPQCWSEIESGEPTTKGAGE